MLLEDALDDAPLHTGPLPVDNPDVLASGGDGRIEELLDNGWNVLGSKGVQIDRIISGEINRHPTLLGGRLLERERRIRNGSTPLPQKLPDLF